jgi:hypothetical protein
MIKNIFLLLAAFFIVSCEDVIDVKLNDKDTGLLNIDGEVSTMNDPFVFIARSVPVNAVTDPQGISGAKVTLTDNANPPNSIELTEIESHIGYYSLLPGNDFRAVAGREYKITIEVDGNTITASDKLAQVSPIDSIKVYPSQYGDGIFLGIFTYGWETPGLGNYYLWDIYVNNTLLVDPQFLAFASDDWVDGNYITDLQIMTDFHDPNKPEERKLNLNDTVVVVQSSISEFAYNYYYQLLNQASSGSMFSVPRLI